jgi:hypothetical protein
MPPLPMLPLVAPMSLWYSSSASSPKVILKTWGRLATLYRTAQETGHTDTVPGTGRQHGSEAYSTFATAPSNIVTF